MLRANHDKIPPIYLSSNCLVDYLCGQDHAKSNTGLLGWRKQRDSYLVPVEIKVIGSNWRVGYYPFRLEDFGFPLLGVAL